MSSPLTFLGTLATELTLARASNSTVSSFASKVPTVTRPSADGTIDLGPSSNSQANAAVIQFFGTDADNETFDSRIIGWRKLGSLYVPSLLVEVSCTLSSSITGIAGNTDTPNGSSDLFVDSITKSNASSPANVDPGIGDALPSTLVVDVRGSEILEIIFDLTGAASANALVAFI